MIKSFHFAVCCSCTLTSALPCAPRSFKSLWYEAHGAEADLSWTWVLLYTFSLDAFMLKLAPTATLNLFSLIREIGAHYRLYCIPGQLMRSGAAFCLGVASFPAVMSASSCRSRASTAMPLSASFMRVFYCFWSVSSTLIHWGVREVFCDLNFAYCGFTLNCWRFFLTPVQ